MATNGLYGAHQPWTNRIDVFDVMLTVTGAADGNATGYTTGGLWASTAVKSAEGKCTIQLTDRTFGTLLQVVPTIENSTLGKTLRCYHDTAVTSLQASGGAKIGLIFVADTNTDTDPDSTVTEVLLRFKVGAQG